MQHLLQSPCLPDIPDNPYSDYMSFSYLPGTVLNLLDNNSAPLSTVTVEKYLYQESAYEVWWRYPQTGEKVLIRVPENRLLEVSRTASS